MRDLHRLRLLQEFAARGSIARTAAVLGYTPSAVSQQLAALEREAGTALLDRSARRAELTDAGRRLAGHAEEIELGGSILTCYHLIRDRLVLVLPRTHPAAAADQPVDLRALRHEPWLAAPSGEPSRQAVDRLLAAVGVAPPVLSEFEGMSTIVSLVARGIGIAILPRLGVTAADRRVAVRDLPHGLDLARDVYAVARTASVRRPSVAVIVTALRAAGPSRHRAASVS